MLPTPPSLPSLRHRLSGFILLLLIPLLAAFPLSSEAARDPVPPEAYNAHAQQAGKATGNTSPSSPAAVPVRGVSGDLWADVVVGKPRFSENSPFSIVPNKLFGSHGTIVDRSSTPNKLYVYDSGNNRILGLDLGGCLSRPTNPLDCSADLVIGQPSMSHGACNGDSGYQLWPVRAEASASTLCLQEESVLSVAEGGTGSSMAVDALGNLYVNDFWNNRVLKYINPFLTDTVADEVWGQTDFTGKTCNRGLGSPNASTLCFNWGNSNNWTAGVELDALGNLWVVDNGNNRVLRFPPGSHQADLVIGQPNFTSRGEGTGLNQFSDPNTARVNSRGWLYVGDHKNGRVLVFEPPFTTGMSGRVFGEDIAWPGGIEFEPGVSGVWIYDEGRKVLERRAEDTGSVVETLGILHDGNVLGSATGSYGIDSDGNKYIAIGEGNYRYDVLMFAPGATTSPTKQLFGNGLGAGNYAGNQVTASGMLGVSGVEVADNQLIATDDGRVLFWNDPASLYSGKPADGALGGGVNAFDQRARGCCVALKADKSHHLYVAFAADAQWLDRLEVYQLPLTNGANPVDTIQLPLPVLGGGTVSATANFQALWGIAPTADSKFLWLSHSSTNRVFRIRDPLTNPTVDVILGQADNNGVDCNRSTSANSTALPNTLCRPGSLALDRLGNLWVSDHSLEVEGNMRLLEFDASLFPTNNQQTIYGPPATRQFPYLATWQPAFNSANMMVVGYNGYYPGNPIPVANYPYYDPAQRGRFPGVYSNPLAPERSRLPDDFLKDFGSMSFTAVFDEQDNLYIGDLNRGRVLIYKKPALEPSPTSTPVPSSPTSTATNTAASTATRTPASTFPATSTRTPTATRTASAVASASSTVAATATACSITFTDVPQASTFEPYVECLVCRGILSGYNTQERCPETGAPCFRPGDSITRGQMAKIVSNAAGFEEDHQEVTFTDVPAGHTFYVYIQRLASRNIVSGYGTAANCPTGAPCFLPEATVSRGQMAKFVASAAGFEEAVPPAQQTFADVPSNDTFWLYIERLASRSVVGGYACGQSPPPGSACSATIETCDASQRPYYRPCGLVTRGQAAKFVSLAFFPACDVP